jgi:branched-chain amino acid transport system permease protein
MITKVTQGTAGSTAARWSASQSAHSRIDLGIGATLMIVACCLPMLDPGRYVLGQMTLFFLWAGIVTQWNLIFGVAGVYSLAQMAVFLVGGYAAAMLGFYFGVSLWIGIWVGGVAAVVFSLAVGMATLRLRGPYVMLLTLATTVAIQALLQGDVDCYVKSATTCYPLTGGPRGMVNFGDFGFVKWLGYKYAPLGGYYLALTVLITGTALAVVVIRSPLGTAFKALRDNQTLAASRGVAKVKFQILVFAIAGFFTGIAGVLYAGQFRTIGPNMLNLDTLLFLLSMLVVGGVGTRWGPLVGCAVIMLSQEAMKDLAEWQMIGFGAITVAFVVFLKEGVVGAADKLWKRWRRQLSGSHDESKFSKGGELPFAKAVEGNGQR